LHRPVALFLLHRPLPRSTLFPYTTLFRSIYSSFTGRWSRCSGMIGSWRCSQPATISSPSSSCLECLPPGRYPPFCCQIRRAWRRSEEHTSELQSRGHLVCRLLLEKQKLTS